MSRGWLDAGLSNTVVCRPDVSLIVPTKNRPALAARAVRSALAQRGVVVEVVVVDDGSTTGPIDPCQWDSDPRVVVLRHETSTGVAKARNTGLAHARAPWVAFLDDDDRWHPDKTFIQLRAIEADGQAEWCCTAACIRDVVGGVVSIEHPPSDRESLERLLLGGNVIPGGGSSVLARTELLRRLGGFDERFKTLADWDLWIRLAAASSAAMVDSVLVDYLINPGGMSANDGVIMDEFGLLRRKHASRAAELDVEFDDIGFLHYVASRRRMAGWRLGAVAAELMIARAERSPKQFLRVIRACVAPQAMTARKHVDGVLGRPMLTAIPKAAVLRSELK